ncbi:serine/threonine kinase [Fragilaria crotonensis]|nr:serine/threonine kinase [Fragilaria crotonensis]
MMFIFLSKDEKLFNSAFRGNYNDVRKLLREGANANVRHNRWTALMAACQNGHVCVVRLLLKQCQTDANAKYPGGFTALFQASQGGKLEVVRELLKHEKVDVNAQQDQGGTALFIASQVGHTSVVSEFLTHRNVDVNLPMHDGTTALHIASAFGRINVVRLLLEHNEVDVNLPTDEGTTALYTASQEGKLEVVRELLTHRNVDVNLPMHDGTTALHIASAFGRINVVRLLLEHNEVDVNLPTDEGTTALYTASQEGKLEVVRELLTHRNVDVNLPMRDGTTALYIASQEGKLEVVQELLTHRNVDVNLPKHDGTTALDVARSKRHDNIVRVLTVETVERDRRSLARVMSSHSADPVELSLEFINQCTTLRGLGSGAFGNVKLVQDDTLQKKFAVKTMNLSRRDQVTADAIRRSFQREVSALKRFRHPNIIALYGFNLNVDHEQLFLVFEHAALGSLDEFFRDAGTRARLPADKRVSIMYQLAKAVHFLHSGGCGGWNVFHRDIKSANVCLDEDFTPRLIDCGLAKLVPDANNATPSESIIPTGPTDVPVFGTREYMCPEYLLNIIQGRTCRYMAAYDVYSLGVVMAELILGRLNCGQTDVFQTYVRAGNTPPIVPGWKRLESHADQVAWNPYALQLVCQTTIRCISPHSQGRLSTEELVPLLIKAVNLQAGIRYSEPEGAGDGPPMCHLQPSPCRCTVYRRVPRTVLELYRG